jgi:hypothetical protein
MPKLVLLPALGTKDDESVFATASAVGRLFNAHLAAPHVRPDMREEIAALATPDFGIVAGMERMVADIEARACW